MPRPLATISTVVLSSISIAVAFVPFVACGGSGDGLPSAAPETGVDAGQLPDTRLPPPHDAPPKDTGPEVDPGAPSDTYPAFPTNMPQIVNNGGYVMTAPTIVTVTWNGDPQQAKFEGFGDAIGGSDYWKQVASEYGIGPATSGAANHVRIADPFPAAGWTTDDVDTFLQAQLTDPTKSGWPAPVDDSIYVLYLPPGAPFTYQGHPACTQIGGYHTSVAIGASNVAYALIPYCAGFGSSHFDSMTSAASHELGEAATDPQPNVMPGFVGYDTNHLGWELFQMLFTENGDSCELYQDSYIRSTEAGFAYSVQRLWSNAQAKAGHDPCVPAPTDPYFTVVPLATESITVNMGIYGGSTKSRSRGYAIPVGTTRLIEVGFISDAPMEDWTIDAQEGTPIFGYSGSDSGHLTLGVVGPNAGKNGNKATISITVSSIGKVKGEVATIVSTNGAGTNHYTPILISSL
jgi:hypothetical protein